MLKGYRTKIYPNKEQQEKIIKFCNAARYAYNWAIATEEENYKNDGKFITGYKLTSLFTEFKKKEGNEWLKEVSARATKIAILDAAQSYRYFFNGTHGHPKFKSKKRSKMKCATHEGTTIIEKKRIRCEKLGWIPSHKHNIPIGDNIKYFNHRLEYDGIDFWFSVSVEVEDIKHNNREQTDSIGIDLGLKTLAVCSNGMKCELPNLSKEKKKLKRLQKKVSKQYDYMIRYSEQTKTKFADLKKSNNLLKLERKINKIYKRITNKLNTNIHTFTKKLINLNPKSIVIEDLNISEIKRNRRYMAEKINESKFYEIRRQLEYKCRWNNIELIIADRFFPSSKMCSVCGFVKKKLSLSERTYVCDNCGKVIDRDFNASINLKNLGK